MENSKREDIHVIGSVGEKKLQEMFGTVNRAQAFYDNQVIDFINKRMSEFIAEQEMMFISTSDSKGNCDCSFRAGERGFVKVLDEKTLLYPEYSGNGVMASLGNIYENPHMAILFIDFFQQQVGLHVNGSAKMVESKYLKDFLSLDSIEQEQEIQDEKATRWIILKVDEAYIHCSRHIPQLKIMKKSWNEKKHGDFFKTKTKNK